MCLLVILPALVLLLSLLVGSSQNIGLIELCQRIGLELGIYKVGNATALMSNMDTILWQVRLPRILLTFMVGSALASSGGVLQAIFRNPIVDPFTLGISSGSAFGKCFCANYNWIGPTHTFALETESPSVRRPRSHCCWSESESIKIGAYCRINHDYSICCSCCWSN